MRFTVRRALLAAAALTALSPLAAQAQAYPDRPVRLLIPYAAGGSTDNMARVLQEPLQKALGQPVIIENKAGASGVIAAREVIRSKPDGYTLFFVNNGNLAVTPSVVKDANYDGVKDFTPIALVSSAAMVAVDPGRGAGQRPQGLHRLRQDAPRGLRLGRRRLVRPAGDGAVRQPRRHQDDPRALQRPGADDHGGRGRRGAAPHHHAVGRDERVHLPEAAQAARRHLARPSPLAPGTPTIGSVLPGYAAESWFAIIGPAGMPPDLVAKLNAAISAAVQLPEIQQRFTTFGVVAKTTTPQKLSQMVAEEVARWTPVIRDNNIRTD